MTNYLIDGHDVSDLFDSKITPISFSDDPRKYIPINGSIIYTIWDNDEKFIYVGISGLQKSIEKRNPISRMISHRSGRRSGDQFCVYVHDFYVIPNLIETGEYSPSRGYLDELTKLYIQNNLSYRFCHFETEDCIEIVRNMENKIKLGIFELQPLLNGLS